MPEISVETLVLAVQAVGAEVERLKSLSDEEAVPDDDELLVQYQTAAAELKRKYMEAEKTTTNLPAYSELVRRTD